jgi:superoxide reductase
MEGEDAMEKQWTCTDDILCGVNVPRDMGNPTDLEKKHVPIIEAPQTVKKDEAFNVTVEIGKLLAHPNEPGHFIEWVELYCGDTFLVRISLSGGASLPKITVPVKLSHAHGPLKAWTKCNLHGLWEGIKSITVEG